jgi:hypothetical protein
VLIDHLLDVALGDLQTLAGQLCGQLTHGDVLKLFGAEPVQVFLAGVTVVDSCGSLVGTKGSTTSPTNSGTCNLIP